MTCLVEKPIAVLVGMSIGSLLLLKMRKDAQTAVDIIEEIDVEDVATINNHEERKDFYGCEADVSLDDMDLSATQPDHISSTSFHDVATLLAKNIRTIGVEISRSIVSEVLKVRNDHSRKSSKIISNVIEVEGLTKDERYRALSKILDHPMQMLIFFSLPSFVR
ncbi:hypothetical protein Gotur_010915, partial [Gossypium turneri]